MILGCCDGQQNYTVLQNRNFLQKMCARARARMFCYLSVLVKLMIRQEAPTGARNKTRCAETNGEDGTGDNPCNEGCCCGPFWSDGDHMAKLLLCRSSIGTRYTLLRSISKFIKCCLLIYTSPTCNMKKDSRLKMFPLPCWKTEWWIADQVLCCDTPTVFFHGQWEVTVHNKALQFKPYGRKGDNGGQPWMGWRWWKWWGGGEWGMWYTAPAKVLQLWWWLQPFSAMAPTFASAMSLLLSKLGLQKAGTAGMFSAGEYQKLTRQTSYFCPQEEVGDPGHLLQSLPFVSLASAHMDVWRKWHEMI